jgi:uncharacterized membrane protein YidH (DUF202 family)
MTEKNIEVKQGRVQNRRVHMANERTFLAWIRTSIGIMAFGFVVEKFAIFMKQMGCFMEQSAAAGPKSPHPVPASPGYSSIVGLMLIALGALMGGLAFIRYKRTERQIDDDTYHPSLILDVLLILSITSIGLFLLIYMWHSL